MSSGTSSSLFARLCTLSFWSTLSLFADWSRPLLFNLFVSRNIKASDLSEGDAAFQMDCVSMGIMSLNIVAFATAYGFNGAVDSLAPMAYGAGQSIELHLILYRQLILLVGLCAILMAILFHAEALLLFIGQPATVAARTGEILGLLAWSVPGDLAYDCLGHWARSQQRQSVVTSCAAAALGVNVAVNLLLADPAAPLFAPIASLIVQNVLLPVLLAASLFCKRPPVTAPLSVVLSGIRKQCQIGVSQMCWNCAELWAWQVQVFEAGRLGAGAAASYALLSSSYAFLIMVPVGVYFGLTSMVGESFGLGMPEQARELLFMGCNLSVVLVLVYAVPLTMFRSSYAGLVSGGVPVVQEQVSAILPVILAMQVFDGLFNILKSWLIVRQHQLFGAVQSLVIYYAVGLPAGFWLAFKMDWGLKGLWCGLGLAVLLGVLVCGARVAQDIRELFLPKLLP